MFIRRVFKFNCLQRLFTLLTPVRPVNLSTRIIPNMVRLGQHWNFLCVEGSRCDELIVGKLNAQVNDLRMFKVKLLINHLSPTIYDICFDC